MGLEEMGTCTHSTLYSLAVGEPQELVLELIWLESFTLVPIARLHCTPIIESCLALDLP